MSALTTIFNFLYVYLRFIFAYIVGGQIRANQFTSVESQEIAQGIINSLGLSHGVTFSGEPILMLVIGVFALGSVIGLAHRLIK